MIKDSNRTIFNFRSQRGVSLMEVLVGMFISVMVIMAAYSIYIVSTRSYSRGEKVTEITQNGRIAIDRMTRDIRQTNEIVTDDPFPEQSPGLSYIEFQDGHVTDPVGDIQYIKYFVESGTADLHKQRLIYWCGDNQDEQHVHKLYDCDAGTEGLQHNILIPKDEVIAEKITDLNFWGQRLINISFKVTEENESFDFTTNVFGRNIP